jgi:hypothetical protein
MVFRVTSLHSDNHTKHISALFGQNIVWNVKGGAVCRYLVTYKFQVYAVTFQCMYVCIMYVCMYVCVYLCMYVFMYVYMRVCIYVFVHTCVRVCVHVCM